MALSRRQALSLGGAGLITASVVPLDVWIRQARAEYTMTRYDAASPEGKAMLKIYADAVGQMKARPPTDPLSWQFQFFTHWMPEDKAAAIERIYGPDTTPEKLAAEAMWDTCRGHITWSGEGDWFVPWHRMYVLYLERIVRQVSGDDSFTLPYWNYTDPAKAAIPEEFRDPASPLYVEDRNPGINVGTRVMTELNLDFMRSRNYLDTAIGGFNSMLDANPHGQVHVNVGTRTNMGNVPTAAKDPVFWIHHAQVDRCWASWNAAGGANPTDASWTDKEFQFYDPVSNQLVSTKTGTVSTTEGLGYVYQDLIPAPQPLTAMVENDKLMESLPLVLADVPLTAGAPSEGPVKLGTGPVTARVAAPQMPLTAGSGDEAKRTYLVISDLATEVQPGVTYDVYLGGQQIAEARNEAWRVGQIHFFNAAPSLEAEAKANAIFTFDVTDQMAVLAAEQGGNPLPQVTFAPADAPAAEAEPLIGNIRFVLE
ncbi:tyrosinase family protein [Sagittula sp. S175]|uniref:tyrosinase family protein n=1 Tax=Sagittula sp. S175 TaxID=3415129 RepID=UPI003C7BF2AC